MGKYCAYSNRGFGNGVVVVTTSENAARLKGLEAVTNGFDSQPRPYFATQIEGKGVGLIANRTIRRGEQIFVQTPAFLAQKDFLTNPEDEEEQERVLDLAVQKLPAPQRRAFMRQMGDDVRDILMMNTFQVDLGGEYGEGHHLGSFPEASKLNHDCRPKLVSPLARPNDVGANRAPSLVFHISANLTHHTRAVRDISPGEELTISYVDTLAPYHERQHRLQSSLGFECFCAQCSLDLAGREDSDETLLAIAELERELSDFSSKRASPALAEELLELYEGEGLQSKMGGAYTLAALSYALAGKEKEARQYATLAAEATEWESGFGSEDAVAMRELARDPRGHWSWAKRKAR